MKIESAGMSNSGGLRMGVPGPRDKCGPEAPLKSRSSKSILLVGKSVLIKFTAVVQGIFLFILEEI